MKSLFPTLWGNDPRDPFKSLREEIDQVFDSFGKGLPASLKAFAGPKFPAVDVAETAEALEVTAELPGVDEKDVDLTVTSDALTIRGEKKSEHEETDKNVHLVERSYGSFSRTVPLPFAADPKAVEATFRNGVLKIHVPKPAEAKKPVEKIAIKTA
ncbi:Hsp20/alpha crystallin family protein [Prosthecomicrobium sp. N25]|uniref:Hsp20/alpha crystallin family protein n=1 Tax=Prosthecomicrobium sp. N25 TaxID=3129254 RepID=UPI003076CA1C